MLNYTIYVRKDYKCIGITYCPYLSPKLRDLRYINVDINLLNFLAAKRKEYRVWNIKTLDDKRRLEVEK